MRLREEGRFGVYRRLQITPRSSIPTVVMDYRPKNGVYIVGKKAKGGLDSSPDVQAALSDLGFFPCSPSGGHTQLSAHELLSPLSFRLEPDSRLCVL